MIVRPFESAVAELRGECTDLPLCVDLDGTLLKTDSLVEMLFSRVKQQPGLLWRLPGMLLAGRAAFKHQLAALADFDVITLPRNEKFLAYLRRERRRGRRLVLATAATRAVAERINERLGLFDEVVASDENHNLSGTRKRDALVRRFGEGGFAYAGNDHVDRPIWASAGEAIVVNAPLFLAGKACREANVSLIFNERRSYAAVLLKALRPHQWAKNLLVFLPLLTAHQLLDPGALSAALTLFIAFGLCASSGYLVNDLLDLESDRAHPEKRHRPLASGALPILHGVALVPALLVLAVLISIALPAVCLLLLGAYTLVSVLYSIHFKRKTLLDVYCLAGLYTLRVLAGGEAAGIECSVWLLSFSAFLFASLALVKRFAELRARSAGSSEDDKRRGYIAEDALCLSTIGIGSGMACVVVLAIYISSPDVTTLYSSPDLLWLICPLLLYWISRVWLISFRGQMLSDPVLFAIKDRVSYAVGIFITLIIVAASFGAEAPLMPHPEK